MADKALFKIKNLTRAFDDKVVLNIPDLVLPKGEIICIVGESGCGKTTLLELLGLMTNPKIDDLGYSDIQINLHLDNKDFNYKTELWNSAEKSADVRRENFSFLFQQANLLPNLNVQENVVLPAIIQDVKKARGKIQNLDTIFDNIHLTHRRKFSTKKLSVGQMQRTAFARSVFRDHSILFADEPTGNLDPFNGRIVFDHIHNYIKEHPENTAIIVTHDLDFALDFSDRIVALTNNGYTDSSRVFVKKDNSWQKESSPHSRKNYEEIKKNIIEIIETRNVENNGEVQESGKDLKIKEFSQFFGEKYKQDFSLIKKDEKGRGKINLSAFLILIFLFAGILAIGFANGSLSDLAEKMADPFVNWLDLDLTDQYRYSPHLLTDSLNTDEIRQRFDIAEVSRFSQFSILINDYKLKGSRFIKGRTIDLDDQILQKLSSKNFLVKGKGFKTNKDLGIIVNQDFFRKFGYSENDLFIEMIYSTDDDLERIVPVPIRGIVRDLPGDNDFLATNYFKYERYNSVASPQPFNPIGTEQLVIFFAVDEETAFDLCDSIDHYFQSNKNIERKFGSVFISDPQFYDQAFKNGFFIPVSFRYPPQIGEIDSIYNEISKSAPFSGYGTTQFYKTHFDNRSKVDLIHDRLSINLKTIDKVFELKNYFQANFDINLDVARVELLKNFYMVKKITITLSWTIIFFTTFSVNIFIFFYLYINLYKQRVHLGSLKAFGLTQNQLQSFYIDKMMTFLLKITIISIFFAILAGYLGVVKFCWSLFTKIQSDSLYFNLIDFQRLWDAKNLSLPLFLLFLFFGGYVSIKLASSRILKHSPGDLIKDRV